MGCCNDGQLFISVIYDDSVAAKDGRLQVGDRVLRVCLQFFSIYVNGLLIIVYHRSMEKKSQAVRKIT